MKKDLKKTGVFALLVTLFFSFVIYEINEFKEEEETKEIKSRVVKLDPDKVDRIEHENFILEKSGIHWRALEGDFKDLLDRDKVEKWLSDALTEYGRSLSEPDEDVEWEKFGFSEDSEVFTFKEGEEETEVTLSQMKSFDDGSYLQVSNNKDKKILFSSDNGWFGFFSKDLNLLREKKAFDWSAIDLASEVKEIRVTRSTNDFKLTNVDGKWTTMSSKMDSWTFDEAKISSFIDDIKSFRLNEFIDERPKNLKSYGTLTVSTDKSKHDLKIFKIIKDYYAESSFRIGVLYTVGPENIDTFFAEPLELRSFDDALLFNQDSVTGVSYKMTDKNFTFFKSEEGEWKVEEELPEVKVFNGASVIKMFSLLKNTKAERFLTDNPKSLNARLTVSRTYKNETGDEFKIYNNEVSCIKGDESNKDCFVLESKKLFLAVKKDEVKDLFEINFLNDRAPESDIEKSNKKAENKEEVMTPQAEDKNDV